MSTTNSQITSARPNRRRFSALAALVLGVACVGVGVVAGNAAEAVLYVDGGSASCSDSGTGTSTAPYCTIGKAAAVATAGQTVQVAAGTYSEDVGVANSGTSSAPIVFQPAAGATVTVTGHSHAFTIIGRSYVQVRGFHVADTTADGISVKSSSNITLADNEVTGAGAPTSAEHAVGIYLESTTGSTISGNRTHHNSDRGIYLNLSDGNTISGNVSYSNAREYTREASGMHIYRSNGNTVIDNVTYGNEDSGINIYQTSSNNLVVDNLTYNNGDHGIDVSQSTTGNRLIGNTVYKNVTAGLNAEGGATGTTIANNIAVDNGIASPRTHSNIRVDNTSTSGSSMNDDLLYLSTNDVMAIWNGTNYSSVAALRSATGQEARGLQADPRWKAAGSGDFHLTAGSPAIDSANSGASGQPATDAEGTARVDDPATTDTGVGPRTYDDRGALEFTPGPAPANSAPTAVDDTATTGSGTPVTVAVLANDTDPDGDTLNVTGATTPAHGTTAVNTDGTVTYTSASAYTGTDTFDYTVGDGKGGTDTGTVTITVTSTGSGGELVGNPGFETGLTGWNTSGSGTGVTLARVSGGHSGAWAAQLTNTGTSSTTCTLNDAPNWVSSSTAGTYTASTWVRADTAGTSFKLRIREYNGSSLVGQQITTATVGTGWQQVTVGYVVATGGTSLDLNAYSTSTPPGTCFYADDVSLTAGGAAPADTAPVAVDDSATTQQDTPVTVNVLANDTDADGDTLTVTGATTPTHGTATVNNNGTVTYTPAAGYTGSDSFDYTVSDGKGGTDTGTVGITVTSGSPSSGNLVGNPDFETGLTGWNTSGSTTGVTLARVTGGHSGSWSAQLTNPTTGTANCTLNDAPNWVTASTAGTYTASIWVKADTAGTSFKLRIREYNGATFVNQAITTVALTTDWQQVTVTYTVATGGTALDLNAYSTSTPVGTCYYADDVSLTRG